MTKSTKAQFKQFLEWLIEQAALGQHIGSNIGVFWLENACRARLMALESEEPFDYSTPSRGRPGERKKSNEQDRA